jgi:hypothetical protein
VPTPIDTIHTWIGTNRGRCFAHMQLVGPASTVPIFSVVLSDSVDLTGQQVADAARADAIDMTGEPTYRLTAREPNGPGVDSLPVRVAGGRPADALGLPDAREAGTPNAALGHSVRLNVELGKALIASNEQIRSMAREVANEGRSEARDLRISVQKMHGQIRRQGQWDVELQKLAYEREDKAAGREFWKALIDSLKPLAAGVVVGVARPKGLGAGPSAAGVDDGSTAAIEAIFESLTDEQALQLFTVLGPDRAARVLRARGPAVVDQLAMVAHACIQDGTMPALLEVFSTNQKLAFARVMKAWSEKHKAADAGVNGAAGPAAPAPAPSDAKEGGASS